MKLSRIKFAKLIGNIERQHAVNMTENEIEDIDNLVDVDIPEPKNVVDPALVDKLLLEIGRGEGFIEAIKAYRTLTGAGLKEAKDAIEKYRCIPKAA
jgi:ribosomal protein L7/L12